MLNEKIMSAKFIKENITRQAKYVEGNMEARSCNHCCCRKAISITYFECMCL
jgi:hypothetical protein